jgi:antitoxin component of MazEF toxin-antitoxin module
MTIKEVPIVEKRKLVASGASVMLVVPKQWLEENQLDKGDEVLMVANGDLCFKKMTKENVDKIRNQLNTHTSSVAMNGEKSADS